MAPNYRFTWIHDQDRALNWAGVRTLDGRSAQLLPARGADGARRRPEQPAPSDQILAVLTDQEREVLTLVAEGLSNEEIAARLSLSPLTSKTHGSRIMTKLNARDRAQLVVLAYESGPVTPGSRANNAVRQPAQNGNAMARSLVRT